MNKIKKGLGRGLSSLIGETKVENKTNNLSLAEIIPNKFYYAVVRRVDSPQRSSIARANLVFCVDEELVSLLFP